MKRSPSFPGHWYPPHASTHTGTHRHTAIDGKRERDLGASPHPAPAAALAPSVHACRLLLLEVEEARQVLRSGQTGHRS